MTKYDRFLCAAGVFLLGTAACSDGGETLRPCPPQGIGVEDHGGFTVNEQILEYQQFDCKEPQICPDNPVALYEPEYLIDDNKPPALSTIGLTNCSTGNKKLVIESAILVGDSRCSFTCDCRRSKTEPCERCQVSIQTGEVNPGETISVAIQYYPSTAGADHAAFRIFSNAQNFNPSVTPMCAWAVTTPSTGSSADAGTTSADSGSALPQCELVTEVNTTCHQD